MRNSRPGNHAALQKHVMNRDKVYCKVDDASSPAEATCLRIFQSVENSITPLAFLPVCSYNDVSLSGIFSGFAGRCISHCPSPWIRIMALARSSLWEEKFFSASWCMSKIRYTNLLYSVIKYNVHFEIKVDRCLNGN